MFRVLTCLTQDHDWQLVVLAIAVCFVSSFAALGLFQRARASRDAKRAGWTAAAGIATGCGIWATHFIAMLAYEPTGFPLAYDVSLTGLSLLTVVAVTTLGLAAAIYGGNAWSGAAGGAIVGAGIAIMHVLGMAALDVPGRLTWTTDLAIASVALGTALAMAAMAIAARAVTNRAMFAAAGLLGLSIVALHFTAMGAILVVPDPARIATTATTISENMLAIAIAGTALAILGIGILAAAMDRRLTVQNAKLDTALNNMNHGLMMFDAESRVILCNERYIDLYRLPKGAIRPGMTLREALAQRIAAGARHDDPERYMAELLSAVARGETMKVTVTMADGRTIATVGEPLPGGGWVSTHQDITEDQQREASFRLLFENSPVPMWVWDHATLYFLAVNDAAIAHYGYGRDRFLRMKLSDLRKPDGEFSVGDIAGYYRRRAADGGTSRHIKADGSVIDVQVYGRPMTYEGRAASLVALVDVTERKKAEQELRRAQEFLNAVIDTVPSTIAVKNASDLTYVLLNKAGEELLDRRREEIIGKTAYEAYDRASADAITMRDKQLIASGDTASVNHHPIRTPAKGRRQIVSTRILIGDETAQPHYLLTVVDDVTERKRAESELRRTRAFLNAVIDHMPAILVVKDTNQRYVLVNRAAEACFGLPRSEIIGKDAHEIFPKATADYVDAIDRDAIRAGETVQFGAHRVETPGNGVRMLTTKKLVLPGDEGAPQHLLSMSEDVTDRARAEERVAHMAKHDTLTDLPNRAAFNEQLAATFERAQAANGTFAVLCVDLDRFKEVNDVFGHAAGDALLCEVARRMHEAAGGAFLSRLGGDEFTLIVAEGEQPGAAETVAERVLAAVASEIEVGGQHLRSGLSIGVAVYPADGRDASTLLANADAALYRAKQDGRGSIRFFAAEMDERLREQRALQQDLRSAIERGELSLHYQPQARIGGEIIGFEALARWHHPVHGAVPPGTFIPIAEESGLIVKLGAWILREACREAASWPQALQIAVNLSPVQFRHGDLPSLVHGVLLETGLAPSRLEVEVTEGVLIGDYARALALLRRLKALGVRIAMDDFGTGYSSLSYLQVFPFDKIKIDGTFISNLTRNENSAAIVRAVIGLGRGLNLPVIAEGVETDEQLAFLTREACDEVQGYFVGRPAPIETYAATVGRRAPEKRKAG